MQQVDLVDYNRKFFELSKIWLSDLEICNLINAGNIPDDNEREQWFITLPQRTDYKIWGVEYNSCPIGVCGLKHITSNDAEYRGYIGEKALWGKGIWGVSFCYSDCCKRMRA